MKRLDIIKATIFAAALAGALFALSACSTPAAESDTGSSSAPAETQAAPAESQAAPASEPAAGADPRQAAIDLGFQVFDGTVHVVDAAALIELQGLDLDPAAVGGGGTYAVLVLDQPTEVTGMSGDGSGERTDTATMIGIAEYTDYGMDVIVDYGDLESWKALDGAHVSIAAEARDIWFPSDVSLPVGEPRANVSKVVQ